jgi:hypothetical protein
MVISSEKKREWDVTAMIMIVMVRSMKDSTATPR